MKSKGMWSKVAQSAGYIVVAKNAEHRKKPVVRNLPNTGNFLPSAKCRTQEKACSRNPNTGLYIEISLNKNVCQKCESRNGE